MAQLIRLAQLIQCIGRRRLAVSQQEGNILLQIMILDETNILANLVLVPAEASRLADALIDQLPARARASRTKKTSGRKSKV